MFGGVDRSDVAALTNHQLETAALVIVGQAKLNLTGHRDSSVVSLPSVAIVTRQALLAALWEIRN